ncbi:hypothetical protein B0H16DRAFT_1550260 [Mycena metata]|uniref:Uncharacterized protein n=1 Tax=Mycena metata TaxID=1033252 RepID=A0AAD7ITL6_9AGAR|nr:hypothetical protein B0H16DRAFT_1550260 [Mycena metata]
MPSLPPELQREIVETAVRMHHEDAAVKLKLSLVAHHFHFWVDRVFYESVTITSTRGADKFLKLLDLKPAGFFAAAVKALNIWGLDDTQTIKVLTTCSGVQILSYENYSNDFVPRAQITQLTLRRLSTLTRVFASSMTSPIAPA